LRAFLKAGAVGADDNVQRLMAEHGDVKLTDLLATLADYPKERPVSIHDRCKAVIRGL